MNPEAIFGSVAMGKDTSGNFKQSLYGLAVRSVAGGGFTAWHDGELVDVTNLTLDGSENLFYRLPKRRPLKKDVVIRSDNPFSALFVEGVTADGTISGIDPGTGQIQDFRPIRNPIGPHFFVTVVGPERLLQKTDDNQLLPLLLLSRQSAGSNAPDLLTSLLLMRSLGPTESAGGPLGSKALMMMLLAQGNQAGGGGSDPLSLLLALQGSDLFTQENEPAKPEPNNSKESTREHRTEKLEPTTT